MNTYITRIMEVYQMGFYRIIYYTPKHIFLFQWNKFECTVRKGNIMQRCIHNQVYWNSEKGSYSLILESISKMLIKQRHFQWIFRILRSESVWPSTNTSNTSAGSWDPDYIFLLTRKLHLYIDKINCWKNPQFEIKLIFIFMWGGMVETKPWSHIWKRKER